MNSFYGIKQSQWLKKAEKTRPVIHETRVEPVALIRTKADAKAWQGVKTEQIPGGLQEFQKPYHWPKTWIFDFGRHVTGTIEIQWEISSLNDSPLRIDFKFAETPYELATDFETYHGHLDRSWLQDGALVLDEFQPVIRFSRRYAFRYVKLRLGAPNFDIHIKSVTAIAQSSAEDSRYTPISAGSGLTAQEIAIDKCSAWTLHECMQGLFEDGPKRDRRLWLGDLRVQALVNGVTYRNFDLVEHCLYILAGSCNEKGEIPGAAYALSHGFAASCMVQTYALLLGPMLLEHYRFSQNAKFCKELYPVALRQIELFRKLIDDKGMIIPGSYSWLFIDHDAELYKETPSLGLYLFSLRRTAELGECLGMPHPELTKEAEKLSKLLFQRCFDKETGLFRADDKNRQLSWATQVWFLLGEVVKGNAARQVWSKMLKSPEAMRPHTPYLWCSVLEAGWMLGKNADVRKIIRDYWGGMLKRKLDTFPEVFVPENPMFSSYGDCLMNSDCHAWSCGAGYYLRLIADQQA